MKRILLATLALAIALPVTQASARTHDEPARYSAPFERQAAVGAASIVQRCEPGGATDTTGSDASTGALDVSLSLEAGACAGATRGTSQQWLVGEAPADLIGTRARIVVTIEVDGASAAASGSGARDAWLTLQASGGDAWTLASATCNTACHTHVIDAGVHQLETTVDELPETLSLTVDAGASMSDAGGSIGASVTATVRSVAVNAT